MPRHAEVKLLPYTPAQMFALVAAVEDYPQFLPWCAASRVKSRAKSETGDEITADLAIGFKMFRETFTSRVLLNPPHEIKVIYEDGPLKRLTNKWIFMDDPVGCRVDFEVDFAFRSRALEAAIGAVFGEAVRRMVGAFETRAHRIYGENG
ncbi:MAG: type II toxin-antitoxin system RatA family toxin [Rhodospirillales bacterium]